MVENVVYMYQNISMQIYEYQQAPQFFLLIFKVWKKRILYYLFNYIYRLWYISAKMLVPLIFKHIFFSQAVNPADQLKTHISGVIAHGQNEFITFLDIGQFPHDSNLTINIILQTLFKINNMTVNITLFWIFITTITLFYSFICI